MDDKYKIRFEETFRPKVISELAVEKLKNNIEDFFKRYSVREVGMSLVITPKL